MNVAAAAKDGRVFASCSYVTGHSWEYEWTGTKWTLIRTLPGQVSSMTVLSSTDVWYFGDHGVVHWNGKTWKQLTKSTEGGSALSDTSVWDFTGEVISHYDGRNWTAVETYGPTDVTGILALSATSVYATGDEVGAATLLHYNGSAWSRVWSQVTSTASSSSRSSATARAACGFRPMTRSTTRSCCTGPRGR